MLLTTGWQELCWADDDQRRGWIGDWKSFERIEDWKSIERARQASGSFLYTIVIFWSEWSNFAAVIFQSVKTRHLLRWCTIHMCAVSTEFWVGAIIRQGSDQIPGPIGLKRLIKTKRIGQRLNDESPLVHLSLVSHRVLLAPFIEGLFHQQWFIVNLIQIHGGFFEWTIGRILRCTKL